MNLLRAVCDVMHEASTALTEDDVAMRIHSLGNGSHQVTADQVAPILMRLKHMGDVVMVGNRFMTPQVYKKLGAPGLAPHPVITDAVEIPEDLLPAPLGEHILEVETEPSPQQAKVELRRLEKPDLGFELAPYSAEATQVMVRQCHRRLLQGWLELGAYLYRAQLHMGSNFWRWFEAAQFPFGRVWARQAIAGVRQVLNDPELAGVVKRMSSIKHFQLAARKLADPSIRRELAERGTIEGQTPEQLELPGTRRMEPHPPETELPTIDALVSQEHQTARERVEKQVVEQAAELAQVKLQLEARTEELLKVRRQLTSVTNPALNEGELEAEFKTRLEALKAQFSPALAELRPLARRDLDGLPVSSVMQFYVTGLLWEKQVALMLREIEVKWGQQYPELLLTDAGQVREPAHRHELKVLRDDIGQTWEGLNSGRLTIISKDGVVLGEMGGAS